VCYDGPFLYATDEGPSNGTGAGALLIYDMSNPFGPTLVSTTALPVASIPGKPFARNGYVYIAYQGHSSVANSRKFAVWNATNPASPTLAGSYTYSDAEIGNFASGSRPLCVAVIGNIACVGMGGGFLKGTDLAKHDVSNPASPALVTTLLPFSPSSAIVNNVLVAGSNFVFGGQRSSAGQAYIATLDPSSFTMLDSSLDGLAGGIADQVAVSQDGLYGYLTNPSNIIVSTWDMSNPSNLTMLDSVDYQNGTGTQVLLASNPINRLYVGGKGGSNIKIIDITDPSNISVVGSMDTAGARVADMALITDGCAGFAWVEGTTGVVINLLGAPPLS
jgi:Uncharacterized conserved protein